MSLMMMLLSMAKTPYVPSTLTQTFTSNGSFTVPAGVTVMVKIEGQGADGTPSSTGSRAASVQIDTVRGYASGSGSNNGALSWSDFNAETTAAYNEINGGGTGSVFGVNYNGYPNTNSYSITLVQGPYSRAVAGTASIVKSSGWKNSGAVQAGDYGFSRISYTERYTIASKTGASATAFGKTFPGGAGVPATTASYANVPVTPLASYSIIVPSGGFVTITYQK